ncbi:hypothetical protein ACIGNX_26160 [Actinosynnema sp. NPDC053489]
MAAGSGLRAVWPAAGVVRVGALVTAWRGLSPGAFREAGALAAATAVR